MRDDLARYLLYYYRGIAADPTDDGAEERRIIQRLLWQNYGLRIVYVDGTYKFTRWEARHR